MRFPLSEQDENATEAHAVKIQGKKYKVTVVEPVAFMSEPRGGGNIQARRKEVFDLPLALARLSSTNIIEIDGMA